MGAIKPINYWGVNEVAIWLQIIGFGEIVDPFLENAVDGEMLLGLDDEDLTEELGLSGIQIKKFRKAVKATAKATNTEIEPDEEDKKKSKNLKEISEK